MPELSMQPAATIAPNSALVPESVGKTIARLKYLPPPATAMGLVSPDTWTGTGLSSVIVPLPSSPEKLEPQAHTVAPDFKARPLANPAAMATTPLSPGTWTGT